MSAGSRLNALAVVLAGCVTPAYYVRPADLGTVATPAIRARDGAEVHLLSDSYCASGETTRADGRVVVRGPGSRSPRFVAGAIVLGAGVVLSVVGAVVALTSIDLRGLGHYTPDAHSNFDLFWFGFSVSILGDGMFGVVGPALMISGAVQRPIELR
jgi:hypothetical protein